MGAAEVSCFSSVRRGQPGNGPHLRRGGRGNYRHADVSGAPSVGDGQWRHVAATCSIFDRRVRIYVDGKKAVDQPLTEGEMLLTTEPLRFGVAMKGALDDVMIWPRTLSDAEVAALAK